MKASGVIDKAVLVFGQMNEPPGVRLRVGLTGLTMAEYFRDAEKQDVLLFIDNIYRYTLAGMEVSALLGRGYDLQFWRLNDVGGCFQPLTDKRRTFGCAFFCGCSASCSCPKYWSSC